LNAWQHVAATVKKGQYITIYINGTPVAQITAFNGDTGNGASPLYFATRGDGYFFQGALDEVRLYCRALTAEEIHALVNGDMATPAPTNTPTHTPTTAPTATPTRTPTHTPTSAPTATPTRTPTHTPTTAPTNTPTRTPTPTYTLTPAPTSAPTATPTPSDVYSVTASTDDAHDRSAYCSTVSGTFGITSGDPHTAGFRFIGITRPKSNATVKSARLIWTAADSRSASLSVRIYAEKRATTTTFNCATGKASLRPKTTAYVNYQVPTWTAGKTYQSPELAPLLNEVLKAAGDAWDGSFVLLVTYVSGDGSRYPKAYEFDRANAAKLTITWSSK
jgi:hypothetical protein